MVITTQRGALDQQSSPAVTGSPQDAIRSLGSLEHLFWLFDQNSFVHFAVTALISGETSARDWRRALDRLQKRHPILSVCIGGEPGSVPSFRQADARPIPLRIVEDEPEAPTPAVYRRRDNARPRVKGLRLSAGLTSSVRDRARQEGTTVHGALCAALVLASRDVSAAWREIPLRILSPINARPLLDAVGACCVFLGATTSVFDRQAMDFWDIARDARIGVAANQTSENIAAQLSAFRQVVGNAAEGATPAEFDAKVFASEVMLSNLGSLSFDRHFGPVTLKAMFGPAVLTGFEGHQTISVATVNGALCLLHTSHTPPEGLLDKTQSVPSQACDERV